MKVLACGTVEGVLDLLDALDRQRPQGHPCRTGRSFGGTELDVANGGVPQDAHTGKPRHGFHEELDLFTTQLREIEEETRQVATWMAKTPGPAALQGIAFQVNADNWDRTGRAHGSPYRIRSGGENHVAWQRDELVGQFGKLIQHCSVNAGLDQDILTVDVSEVA